MLCNNLSQDTSISDPPILTLADWTRRQPLGTRHPALLKPTRGVFHDSRN